MNEQELDALPEGAVVLDRDGGPRAAWQKVNGRWTSHAAEGTATSRILRHAGLELLHPVPEPDHSMCARHDPSLRRAVQEAIGEASVCWDNMSGAGVFDVARANAVADRLCAILDIPEPEPTVVERAAAEIQRADERGDDSYKAMARALADAGLLVRDGEQ